MSIMERKINSPRFHRKFPARTPRSLSIVLVVCLATLAIAVVPASALSRTSETSAQAKAKVAQAKRDANQAAIKYSQAYSALAKIDDELADTQSRLSSAEQNIGNLQTKASEQAKEAYIRSSDEARKQSYEDVINESRRDQFLATVSEFDDAQLTTLVGMQEDLQIAKDELAALQKDQKDTLNELNKQKKALDAKLAAATKAQKDLEARLSKAAKARLAAQRARNSNTAVGTIINSGNGPLACPVQGSRAFTNDWGQPRSGGRTHKGTDIFAPRGTPNVAVVSGTVFYQNEGTGGRSAYVTGGGNTYYYTHLNDYVGGARTVQRGEVIGHTGNSGNADGGAYHTHFEIRLGGPNGTRVNPYPTLRSIC